MIGQEILLKTFTSCVPISLSNYFFLRLLRILSLCTGRIAIPFSWILGLPSNIIFIGCLRFSAEREVLLVFGGQEFFVRSSPLSSSVV